MEQGEVFISEQDGTTFIRVKGNASFASAPPLRELAKKLAAEPFGGLKKDFAFENGTFGGSDDAAAASNATTAESNARNVLDAHQTLMDIDAANVPKFEKVVEYVKKDIDKMEQGGKG